jgi:2-C-methyl-D-erythritol 4-phosphate cytidylyltransferase
VGVVVPAAGVGRRLGAGGAKALVRLGGRALLAHAVEAMEANRRVTAVVIVAHPDTLEVTRKLVAEEGFAKVTAVVAGGPSRQASVAAGLAALPPEPTYVAVHDAARPLVRAGAVDALLEQLLAAGVAGAVPGVPVIDTIRRVDPDRRSGGIVDRAQLAAMQTPQLFVRELLEEAHRLALRDRFEATDEAALVERAGHPVQIVPGDPENLKVTTSLDLAVAETVLARRGPGNPEGVPRSIGRAPGNPEGVPRSIGGVGNGAGR